MKHEINIDPSKEEGIVEVSQINNVSVLKKSDKKYICFSIKDTKGFNHTFNFDIDGEPKVGPGTKIKVRFIKTVDLEWAEIAKTGSTAASPAPHEPVGVQDKTIKKPVPKQEPKPPVEPAINKTDEGESFIEFDTFEDSEKIPMSANDMFKIPDEKTGKKQDINNSDDETKIFNKPGFTKKF
ncbi:MAG: hypothetical protein A2161_10310 [Candidatus Schekmanbacteria bacterium RBG_13_48_7]|uniref:Uncharacterized protein n=1 Tax=Candidatus Schekmanbacteria bacterium RBG_13_48_7 TaxID=1817878 RepID=A0A1F7S0R6_9BACT|nr:MAG: hypothetical protein A2161_10310 [Candidatus Schekmanbacteria bacterium RBG_13_48_7]